QGVERLDARHPGRRVRLRDGADRSGEVVGARRSAWSAASLDWTALARWRAVDPGERRRVAQVDRVRAAVGAPHRRHGRIQHRARLHEAARHAQIHDFIISELPNGYESILGDKGLRLSSGQRQRIGLARALYNDPAVLVLDEVTNALDTPTERRVIDGLLALRP